MRLFTLFAILILTVSCGKDGGSSSNSAPLKNGCASGQQCQQVVEGALDEGVDLLETMIDVPVRLNGTELTFLGDKSSTVKGKKISCDTNVRNGEIYRLALRGDTLQVMTSNGTYEMQRLNDGNSIIGNWVAHEYDQSGRHVSRQITFLSEGRVVMITKCEFF